MLAPRPGIETGSSAVIDAKGQQFCFQIAQCALFEAFIDGRRGQSRGDRSSLIRSCGSEVAIIGAEPQCQHGVVRSHIDTKVINLPR